jgi:hypothetical protein
MSALMHRTVALLVVVAAMASGTRARTQQGREEISVSQLANKGPQYVAMALAAAGHSAGIVVKLPEGLRADFRRAKGRTDAFAGDKTAFSVILHGLPPERVLPVQGGISAEQTLRAYAARQPSEWDLHTAGRFAVMTLASRAAPVCAAALHTRVRNPQSGTSMLQLISAVIHDATGASVPGGFVGTCVGANLIRRAPEYIEANVSLESALNDIVFRYPGTAWLAVESPDQECSLGVVERREDDSGGVCVTTITADLSRHK